MRGVILRTLWWRLGMLAMAGALLLAGCDAQTQTAVENGAITASSSFVGALLQAIIQLASAQATTT